MEHRGERHQIIYAKFKMKMEQNGRDTKRSANQNRSPLPHTLHNDPIERN